VRIEIELNDTLFAELESVRRETNCFSAVQIAQEFIESGLAERRLPHVTAAALGARPFGTPGKDVDDL
jgi:hypothetical protein